jgi:hypothetical protein
MTPSQPTLFDVPRARTSDPATSHAALTNSESRNVERAILILFRPGVSYTDDELVDALQGTVFGPTARSARSRLARQGHLYDTGERRLSARGRPSIVWRRT